MTADDEISRARSEAKREVQRLRDEISATVDAIEYKLDVKRQAGEAAERVTAVASDLADRAVSGARSARFRVKRFAEEDPVLLGTIGAAAVALIGGGLWATLASRR